MRAPKYRNVHVTVDGIDFASKKEARRYGELKLLEKVGQIGDLQLQPVFPLKVGGHLVCKYVADFAYRYRLPNGELSGAREVEDVKSDATRKNRAYRIKFKLFEAIHGFPIREV